MDLGLGGATAVVNGGSKGMGRAAAECLAREGASVAVLARTPSVLDETVAALRELGAPDAVGIPTDLTSTPEVIAAAMSRSTGSAFSRQAPIGRREELPLLPVR